MSEPVVLPGLTAHALRRIETSVGAIGLVFATVDLVWGLIAANAHLSLVPVIVIFVPSALAISLYASSPLSTQKAAKEVQAGYTTIPGRDLSVPLVHGKTGRPIERSPDSTA